MFEILLWIKQVYRILDYSNAFKKLQFFIIVMIRQYVQRRLRLRCNKRVFITFCIWIRLHERVTSQMSIVNLLHNSFLKNADFFF